MTDTLIVLCVSAVALAGLAGWVGVALNRRSRNRHNNGGNHL